eukprot:gene3486-6135_t
MKKESKQQSTETKPESPEDVLQEFHSHEENKVTQEDYTQNKSQEEELNNEETDELNFDELVNGEDEVVTKSIVEKEEKVEKTKENFSVKSVLVIILQVAFVITFSVLKYLYLKLESVWKNTTEKAKKIYEKEEVQKYVQDANETFENLNLSQKYDELKNTAQTKLKSNKNDLVEFYENSRKKLIKLVQSNSFLNTYSEKYFKAIKSE